MKLKHFLLAGIGLMVTGGLLAGVTYAYGAQKNLTWENGPKLIEMAQETQKISADKKIDRLEISAENQAVIIKRGLDFEITTVHEKKSKPIISVKDNTLAIAGNEKERNTLISMEDDTAKIIITIPKNIVLSEIKIEGNNSPIELDEVKSKALSTNTYGGALTLTNIDVDKLTADDKLGSIYINDETIQQMAVSTSDSQLSLKDLAASAKGNIDLQNSHLDLYGMEENNLDLQLSGDSHLEKNGEEITTESFGQKDKTLTITGQNSIVQILDDTESDYDDYNDYD
ncbi:DUF4097 domain-containing protein [Enterococcus durans]|uniref:DUF4097 domain-containing protein n=1 Tax=Enterococcus durans TaxID=53345 RepID=A0A5N0YNX8_9ENTE|nr:MULTISPECIES: DUF4097 family beta strand repeat-containing protein [Enterococcus]KAA9177005.1 DUF4097 domain-containing protein [Enterococcus durans]KAA9182633.1 DUF4097 domain-containing protein [Enterococcus durans]KAA9183889.1 DUF4097 domain-containing protein [Enterococcus durans]KAA9188671.1 DUF4097 domain-containing protein [Enterococcus durans]KAA9190593.1 DUF4097 domain-containing protein [Enterococcus durans]